MNHINTEARAQVASNKSISLSGNTYVSAMLRENEGRYPPRDFIVRLPYVEDARQCQHGVTICSTWECVESWSVDYEVRLWRTGAGREIARKLRLDLNKPLNRKGITVLRHEDFVTSDPA